MLRVRGRDSTDLQSPAVGRRIAQFLALWAFAYACYRAYYAAGGQAGMIGRPVSTAQWRAINGFGATVILLAAIVPLVAVRARSLRRVLPVLGWIGAVGCVMHALTDGTLRVFSISG